MEVPVGAWQVMIRINPDFEWSESSSIGHDSIVLVLLDYRVQQDSQTAHLNDGS